MKDHPDYDIAEFLLAGVFIAASGVALVWWVAGVMASDLLQTAEAAGLVLMFLGGAVHPKQFVFDCLTFPLRLVGASGRETRLTAAAAWLGGLLWAGAILAGWLDRG
ncbi:MAG TPA: hypothetical protein VK305_13905 [Roseateles sp.]|nr:hypothetical protein [Roseateles sp.]